MPAQPRRLLCVWTRFHGDAAIGDGILQCERPDTGLRSRVTNQSWDFLILNVKAGDSSVVTRRLGIQNIVYEGFQELSPEFA